MCGVVRRGTGVVCVVVRDDGEGDRLHEGCVAHGGTGAVGYVRHRRRREWLVPAWGRGKLGGDGGGKRRRESEDVEVSECFAAGRRERLNAHWTGFGWLIYALPVPKAWMTPCVSLFAFSLTKRSRGAGSQASGPGKGALFILILSSQLPATVAACFGQNIRLRIVCYGNVLSTPLLFNCLR